MADWLATVRISRISHAVPAGSEKASRRTPKLSMGVTGGQHHRKASCGPRHRNHADYAFLSTALSRGREIERTRTWTFAWACFSTGPNGDSRRTHTPAPPDNILSSPSPSPQPPLHAHRLTSRGMMMGLPVKGHPPRRVHQLPIAKGNGTTVSAAPTWKRTLPAPTERHGPAAGAPSMHCPSHASRQGLPCRW